MSNTFRRGTLLRIPALEEKYGRPFLISLGIHLSAFLSFMAASLLLPRPSPVVLGTGPGGGTGGGSYTVGVADELGGGIGMSKPSPIPQPPALPVDKSAKEEIKQDAVPLPHNVEPKKPDPKSLAKAKSSAKQAARTANSNVIPTKPQPGMGGTGGTSTGAGGQGSGGVGVSLGGGSGGFGDSWYARAVESRIGSNWIRPAVTGRIEIVYSFFITNEGTIRDIKKEKSSGNDILDLTAERAIRASNPLPKLPPELRGRSVQFMAQFIHPPNP